MNHNIPFAKSSIGTKEIEAVNKVLRSGWLTQGNVVKEFEEEFAKYVGSKYAVAVNSCTSALFLCLKYKTLQKKIDGICVPSLTFTASASIADHLNLPIWFLDCKKDFTVTNNINNYPDRGNFILMSVHLTGNESLRVFEKDNIEIIEDSAHRILRGTQGDNPVCYSFYATKNMTTGEGGMITTNDEGLYNWLRLARLHGSDKDGFSRYKNKDGWKYEIKFCGWKMNMTDINAAIGLVQLAKLDKMNEERTRIVNRYNHNLGLNRTGLHLYPIRVDRRDEFMQYMLDKGVHCSVHFLPLHKMPAYAEYDTTLKKTEVLGNQLVSLPLYPDLTDDEVDYISECVLNKDNFIQL